MAPCIFDGWPVTTMLTPPGQGPSFGRQPSKLVNCRLVVSLAHDTIGFPINSNVTAHPGSTIPFIRSISCFQTATHESTAMVNDSPGRAMFNSFNPVAGSLITLDSNLAPAAVDRSMQPST